MTFNILIPLQKIDEMKHFGILVLLVIVLGCKSNRINKILNNFSEKQLYELANCMDDATCSIEIIPRSNLLIKEDAFNNTYIEIEPGTKTVIKYLFERNEIPNTADSNYSEMIYLETDNYDKNIRFKNESLAQVKMVYGRLCFCKGSSGYFKVKKGELELILKKNELTLKSNFSIDNIPQLLTEINENITLRK